MISQILRFWKETWIKSKVLFLCEAIGTVAALSATWVLATFTGQYLAFVFSIYVVGNILYLYAAYKRENAWLLVMTAGFMSFNMLGLVNLLL